MEAIKSKNSNQLYILCFFRHYLILMNSKYFGSRRALTYLFRCHGHILFISRIAFLHILWFVFGFFTVRNSSCGKVMFSQVSCLSTGGGDQTRSPPGQTPLARLTASFTPTANAESWAVEAFSLCMF